MLNPCEGCIALACGQEPSASSRSLGQANQAAQEDKPAKLSPAPGSHGEDQVAGGAESLSPTGPLAALAPLGPSTLPLPSAAFANGMGKAGAFRILARTAWTSL